jgi:polyhydroxyalkanoate synthesis regulator phasin
MKKKMAAAGLTAGLIAGAGAGLLLELSGNADATNNSQTAIVAPAGESAGGGTTGRSGANSPDRLQTILQPLVDKGTITQAQADQVIAALQAAGPTGGRTGGPTGDDGQGLGGHDGGGRMGGGRMGGGRMGGGMLPGGGGLEVVASTLGITTDQVMSGIQGGKTIAQLATDHGSSAQKVIDALVAAAKQHIDQEVTTGEITKDEATTKLADATARITDAVNHTTPDAGGRGGFPGGHDGMGDGPGTNGPGTNGTGTNGTGGGIDAGPPDTPTTTTTTTG